ncbi:MAG: HypC/HybG/HupF family hydrogenase formation chaperone [Raoultibacter sp.]
MCLAIPAKIIEIKDDHMATVDILGVTRDISLDLTPKAELENYVLVHAGFAIEVVDEQFAQETLDLIREFPELALEDAPEGASFGAPASINPLGL